MAVVEYSSKASIGVTKRVPSGYLAMGSRFHPREFPIRTEYVAEFDLAQTPVTVMQYAAFLNSGAACQERWWSQAGLAWLHGLSDGWGREDRWKPEAWEVQKQRPYNPVIGITWNEALAYCSWVAHEKKCIVRLPTEEEWEYAARGEDSRPFPWGEEFDSNLTNTLEREVRGTVDVASISGDISPFGVMDMGGNVQEWTASTYKPLPSEFYYTDDLCVVRGGSFNDTSFGARTSYRRAYPRGYFYPFLGFRIVVAHR